MSIVHIVKHVPVVVCESYYLIQCTFMVKRDIDSSDKALRACHSSPHDETIRALEGWQIRHKGFLRFPSHPNYNNKHLPKENFYSKALLIIKLFTYIYTISGLFSGHSIIIIRFLKSRNDKFQFNTMESRITREKTSSLSYGSSIFFNPV